MKSEVKTAFFDPDDFKTSERIENLNKNYNYIIFEPFKITKGQIRPEIPELDFATPRVILRFHK